MTEQKNYHGRLLIVEDNPEESLFAHNVAEKVGFKDIVTATNLSDALNYIPDAHAVATDLFFPAGNMPTEQYSQRFLPYYKSFKEDKFRRIDENSPVLRAIKVNAKIFGVTPEVYVNDYMTKMNTPQVLLRAAQDAVAGFSDSVKYREFQGIEERIRNGTNLPLGIIVTEKATKLGIPSVIVTSTNHHDAAFEPVRNMITVPYYDTLIGGKKNWASGLERLASLIPGFREGRQ